MTTTWLSERFWAYQSIQLKRLVHKVHAIYLDRFGEAITKALIVGYLI